MYTNTHTQVGGNNAPSSAAGVGVKNSVNQNECHCRSFPSERNAYFKEIDHGNDDRLMDVPDIHDFQANIHSKKATSSMPVIDVARLKHTTSTEATSPAHRWLSISLSLDVRSTGRLN